MSVDTDPFPTATVNMVDACLPKDKGKGKAEDVATQRFRNQNSRPRFMVDFCSNKPPTALTGPAIVKPMIDYTTDEDSGTAVLCSKCRAKVGSEPKDKPSSLITKRPTAATQQKVADVGQHQGVFDRLGPKVRMEEAPQPGGVLILMLHFTTRTTINVILVVRSHRGAKKLSNLPNLAINVGIHIILRKAFTPHCPNPRNAGTKR
ncbi:hypothetical protein ACFX19_013520 [Malus domestica]